MLTKMAMGNHPISSNVGGEVVFKPIPINDKDSMNPTMTWDKLKVKHTVKPVDPVSWSTPKPEGHTRFVCISDTHNKTDGLQVPDGDVLLHGGDFTMVGLPGEIEHFVQFLRTLPHKHKVSITHTIVRSHTVCTLFQVQLQFPIVGCNCWQS